MLSSTGQQVPQLGDGGSAVWNRRARILEASTGPLLETAMNTFLADLGTNPIYALGAVVLDMQLLDIPPNDFAALIDYGYYTPT